MRMRLPLVVLLLATVGCDSGEVCSDNCPKLEGSYKMTYKDLTAETPDCMVLPAPAGPATVEIMRSGAEVRATLYGNPGRGMLQVTSDFSIAADETPDGGADAGTQSYTLRGYFVPAVLKGDGGTPATITGKWITHGERSGKVCDAERPYTGTRQ